MEIALLLGCVRVARRVEVAAALLILTGLIWPSLFNPKQSPEAGALNCERVFSKERMVLEPAGVR